MNIFTLLLPRRAKTCETCYERPSGAARMHAVVPAGRRIPAILTDVMPQYKARKIRQREGGNQRPERSIRHGGFAASDFIDDFSAVSRSAWTRRDTADDNRIWKQRSTVGNPGIRDARACYEWDSPARCCAAPAFGGPERNNQPTTFYGQMDFDVAGLHGDTTTVTSCAARRSPGGTASFQECIDWLSVENPGPGDHDESQVAHRRTRH